MSLRIASSNLNQTPLDWYNNLRNIKKSIEVAQKNNVEILCLPELSITGYGCQDLFFHDWFIKKSCKILDKVVEFSDSMYSIDFIGASSSRI